MRYGSYRLEITVDETRIVEIFQASGTLFQLRQSKTGNIVELAQRTSFTGLAWRLFFK